jgi:hypothetical protein
MADYTGSTGYSTTLLSASGTASVQYSADESLIYVARRDGKIDVFDTETKALVATWNVGTSLGGMSLSGDGSFLLVTGPDKVGTVYRVATANGAVQTIVGGLIAYTDVEIVDHRTALLVGPGGTVKLDLNNGTFPALYGGTYYGTVAVETSISRCSSRRASAMVRCTSMMTGPARSSPAATIIRAGRYNRASTGGIRRSAKRRAASCNSPITARSTSMTCLSTA